MAGGLACEIVERTDFGPGFDRDAHTAEVVDVLRRHDIDLVAMAGWGTILGPAAFEAFGGRILNTHPALLPSFPGAQAYRQAYEHGVKIAGVTAHFVSMHLDEGPIIAQDSFTISPRMTLKDIVARGQALEAKVLLKAVKLYLAKRLDVYWGVVKEV